jgi:molybdopterin-guanine dinucleotide biosynthesis protein A
MTGIVLAGGKNIRMGRNKATLPWKHSDFLHVILQKLSSICTELIVVTNTPLSIKMANVHSVSDIIPDCGPLSGIHAGLRHASSPEAFITACDMPYIQPAAVAWLGSRLGDWDAVVPDDGFFREPLFACYAKTCIPVIELLLAQGVRKTQTLFEHIRYQSVPVADLHQFDPSLRLLQNINAPEDYQRALHDMDSLSVI